MSRSRRHSSNTRDHRDSSAVASDVLATTERAALHRAVVAPADAYQHERLLADALEWARAVRLHALLLDQVLTGDVDIVPSADGTDLNFRQRGGARVIPFDRAAARAGAPA